VGWVITSALGYQRLRPAPSATQRHSGVGAKTGTSGKIFGSVTGVQIARAIKEQKGYEIDRRRIHILGDVKELGTYKARLDFGKGNETELEFEVVSE
jgi:large subunit ribosomal protein L9